MIVAGIAFAFTSWVPLLILAGAIGVISPTGNEVGPFLAIEQAALSQTIPDARRTATFAWYNLVGLRRDRDGRPRRRACSARRSSTAAGRRSTPTGRSSSATRCIGLVMVVGFWRLEPGDRGAAARGQRPTASGAGSGSVARRRSSLKLSVLFSLDAFGGGFIPQSLMAYWFHLQYGVDPATLGLIFFGANLLAAVSSLLGGADRGADRPAQHDGLHPPAVERAADPRPAHADPAAGDRRPAPALHAQPDGRPDAPVVRHRGRRPGRALGGGRGDRRRPDDRRGDLAVDLVGADRERRATRRCRSTSRAASRSCTTC